MGRNFIIDNRYKGSSQSLSGCVDWQDRKIFYRIIKKVIIWKAGAVVFRFGNRLSPSEWLQPGGRCSFCHER